MSTRSWTIVLAAALAWVAVGGGAGPALAQKEPATLLVLTRNQPRSLDPAKGSDNPTRKVFVGVYEPLIDHKQGTADIPNLEGVLAKTWKLSDDQQTYTFNLRENVKFHDGSSLSADDVKVSLDRMRQIKLGHSWVLDPVKEIRVVDPMTVQVVLTRPYPPFLLGLPLLNIVSARAVKTHEKDGDLAQAWFNTQVAGTGPYRLSEFRVGQQIVLDRFEGYWRGWREKRIDRVVLKLVAESATQRLMMEGGQGDWADTILPGDFREMEKKKDFHATKEPTWGIFWLMMNTNKAPLDNVKVRRALRFAYPYTPMLNDVMLGRGAAARGYLPPGFYTHDDSPAEKTDLNMARQLLTEAGFPKGGFELTLAYTNIWDFQRQSSEMFAANLRQLGIDLKIQGPPWATMMDLFTNASRRPHLAFYSADADTADPDSTLYKTFHSRSTHWSNYGFGNPEVDGLLERARYETNREERVKLYKRVQGLLQELSPGINTLVATSNHLLRSNVKGYVFHPPYGYGAINYYYLWKE
jgi:peptide/nickel transport system substrate-binding protein